MNFFVIGESFILNSTMKNLKVVLAQPRGFCAGVERAITIVEEALNIHGPPVYVRHEIVHNRRVVETLRRKGAVFVKEVRDIPDGGVTIFSAHGISEKVEQEAKQSLLPIIDATCPLVSKVHVEGQKHAAKLSSVILIGHAGHPEVEGTMGRINGDVHLVTSVEDITNVKVQNEENVAYITQTTLSVDDTRTIIEALRSKYPNISGPDVRDICYATQNRQQAVRNISHKVDTILIVGAQNSSNSNRLREIGAESGVPSFLIDDADGLNFGWLDDIDVLGISAGASAPEELVLELIEKIKAKFVVDLHMLEGVQENVQFKLPREITESINRKSV